MPLTDIGRKTSAPSCFASAFTKRVPRRLLVAGSNPAGRPAPSSRIETRTEFFSVRHGYPDQTPIQVGIGIFASIQDQLIDDKSHKDGAIRRELNFIGRFQLDFERRNRRFQVSMTSRR